MAIYNVLVTLHCDAVRTSARNRTEHVKQPETVNVHDHQPALTPFMQGSGTGVKS